MILEFQLLKVVNLEDYSSKSVGNSPLREIGLIVNMWGPSKRFRGNPIVEG